MDSKYTQQMTEAAIRDSAGMSTTFINIQCYEKKKLMRSFLAVCY